MKSSKWWLRGSVALAIATALVVPTAGATTLIRASLDDLVEGNRTIVVGQVVDARSYWNEDHSFILTDVLVALDEVLKGTVGGRELEVTIMGGHVGKTTTVIVGGAELVPGNSYVLFLNEESLPGREGVLTVRDLSQGAFDLRIGRGGLRAISQVNGHPLVPDRFGNDQAPGGLEGLPFTEMVQWISESVGRQASSQEVP